MPRKYIPLRVFFLFILFYNWSNTFRVSLKNTTKSQPLIACKVQLKNKKRVFLLKHPFPVVTLVIKVYTLENGLS